MKYSWLVLFCFCGLLCGCSAAQAAADADMQPPASTPAAQMLHLQVCYTLCGHVLQQGEATMLTAAATPEALMQHYSGFVLVESTPPTLRRQITQYCPRHYVIKLYDGRIILCRNVGGTDRLQQVTVCRYVPAQFPSDYLLRLVEGIACDDLDAAMAELQAHLLG